MAEMRIPIATLHRPAAADARVVQGALLAGLVAGTACIAVLQWLAVVAYDESAWKLPRMMAAIVRGPVALSGGDELEAATVALGFGVHYVLSLLYALALAGLLRELPREQAPLVGLAFGALLYAANLHGFTSLFPWFAEMRTPDTFVAHAIFGLVAACAYCEFSRPRVEDVPD